MDAQRLIHDFDRFDIRLFTLGGTPITVWDLGFIVVALMRELNRRGIALKE